MQQAQSGYAYNNNTQRQTQTEIYSHDKVLYQSSGLFVLSQSSIFVRGQLPHRNTLLMCLYRTKYIANVSLSYIANMSLSNEIHC